jgi:hypothetical protein
VVVARHRHHHRDGLDHLGGVPVRQGLVAFLVGAALGFALAALSTLSG